MICGMRDVDGDALTCSEKRNRTITGYTEENSGQIFQDETTSNQQLKRLNRGVYGRNDCRGESPISFDYLRIQCGKTPWTESAIPFASSLPALCAKGAGVSVSTSINNANAASHIRPPETRGQSATSGWRRLLTCRRTAHRSQPAHR